MARPPCVREVEGLQQLLAKENPLIRASYAELAKDPPGADEVLARVAAIQLTVSGIAAGLRNTG